MTEREERDDFIRREYGQGRMSSREIGLKLGMCRNSVISRAHYLGLGAKQGSADLAQHRSEMAQRPRGKRNTPAPARPLAKIKPPVKGDPGKLVWNNKTALPDRSRPAETARVLQSVAVKHHPHGRLCAWRTYEGDGRSMPCCESAEPGHMWCGEHLKATEVLRETA